MVKALASYRAWGLEIGGVQVLRFGGHQFGAASSGLRVCVLDFGCG